MVGNEGMFPISVVLGADTSAFTCLVQGPGRAFCISRPALLARMAKDHALVDLLNRYADASQTQLAREAVCMNHHTVRQRLARRLLMNRDCSHSAELFLTHQSLAFMLDVRRESVSRAASEFEKLGLISYSHGYMVLLDEPGLERISCHCYRANLQAYDRCLESLDIERIFALRR